MKTLYPLTAIIYTNQQAQHLNNQIAALNDVVEQILVVAPQDLSVPANQKVSVIYYDNDTTKTTVMNLASSIATQPWILWLEADEHFIIDHLQLIPFNKGEAHAFLIETDSIEGEPTKKFYQTRIFEKIERENIFRGNHFPDLAKTAQENDWTISEIILPIQKSNHLFPAALIEKEIELNTQTPLAKFWEATLQSDKGNYAKAENIFRKLIKFENNITFEQVAAYNGLADALMEQHLWDQAEIVALESINLTKLQRAPYLILFKVNYVNGRWEKAYTALKGYSATLDYESRATMDVVLPYVECQFLMAESCYRNTDFAKAFTHYENFYELNNGQVAQSVIERLFIYSIELDDFDKSVRYFNAMFGDYLEEQKNEDMPVKLFESLSLFNKNGWYDFVSNVYEQLRGYDPDNKKLLHGWVATLVKANKLEQAQELIGFMKKKKPA